MDLIRTFLSVRKVPKEAVAVEKLGERYFASGPVLNSPVELTIPQAQTVKPAFPTAKSHSLSLIFPRRQDIMKYQVKQFFEKTIDQYCTTLF